MTADPSRLYSRRPGSVSADLGEELAVLDMHSGSYLGFNATAAHLWRLLDQPRSLEALCEAMRAAFEVDAERCRAAVIQLLERLQAADLVVQTDG